MQTFHVYNVYAPDEHAGLPQSVITRSRRRHRAVLQAGRGVLLYDAQCESITTWSNTDRLARLARGRFDLSGWSVSGIQVKFARGSSHPPLSPAPAPPEPFKKTLSLPRTTFSISCHHILSGFSVVLHNSFGTTPSFSSLVTRCSVQGQSLFHPTFNSVVAIDCVESQLTCHVNLQ